MCSLGRKKRFRILREMNTISGQTTLLILFMPPSEKKLLLKVRIFSAWEQTPFFLVHTPVYKGLGVQKNKQETTKIVSLVK